MRRALPQYAGAEPRVPGGRPVLPGPRQARSAGDRAPPHGAVSYHLRTGKHDQNKKDWAHYLDLADMFFK